MILWFDSWKADILRKNCLYPDKFSNLTDHKTSIYTRIFKHTYLLWGKDSKYTNNHETVNLNIITTGSTIHSHATQIIIRLYSNLCHSNPFPLVHLLPFEGTCRISYFFPVLPTVTLSYLLSLIIYNKLGMLNNRDTVQRHPTLEQWCAVKPWSEEIITSYSTATSQWTRNKYFSTSCQLYSLCT